VCIKYKFSTKLGWFICYFQWIYSALTQFSKIWYPPSKSFKGFWNTYSHFNKIVEINIRGQIRRTLSHPLKVVSSMQRSHRQIRSKSVMEPTSKEHPDNIILKMSLRPNLPLQFTPSFASPICQYELWLMYWQTILMFAFWDMFMIMKTEDPIMNKWVV